MTDSRCESTTSTQFMDALKNLLICAFDHYSDAVKCNDRSRASYWDGYIRGIREVINNPAHENKG